MIDSPWKRAAMCIAAVVLVCAAVSGPARADLLGYWNLDDATSPVIATDSSGCGNDGTISGATYTADAGGHTGMAGDYALDFGTRGNGAHVYIRSSGFGAFDSMTANNEATVSLWVYGDASQPQSDTAFGFYNNGDTRQFQAHIPWGNGNIYFDVGGCCGSSQRISASAATGGNFFPIEYEGDWHHYAFVKDASGSKIYYNGAEWLSGATTAPIGQILAAYIGSEVKTNNSYAGLIDDYAVWDEALTPAQIADLASGAASPADWATATPTGYNVNVASAFGTATQSSTRTGSGGNVADVALDGDANGTWGGNSITHTLDQPDSWWEVDLGDTFAVDAVRLFNRADCCPGRLGNFHLSVLDEVRNEVWGQDVAGTVDQLFGETFHAPATTEGRYVRVQLNGSNNDGNGILSLAEVQVMSRLEELPNGINVAYALGHATQSSTRVGTGGNDASFAIDGDTDGEWGRDSVTHTNSEANPWWEVDLGQSLKLENIKLFNRDGCCPDRLGNFHVSVLDDVRNEVWGLDFAGQVDPTTGENFILPFDTTGRFVRVQLNDTNVLSIAEAQVLGGPLANLARNPDAVATQSSTAYGGDPARAIDGETNGVYGNNSVTHTGDGTDSWWQVDLGGTYELDEVVLYNRTDTCCVDRLSNFRLSVWDNGVEVYGEDFFTGPGTHAGHSFRVDFPNVLGDMFRIQLLGSNNAGNGFLSLAEVQVYGRVPEPSTVVLFGLGAVALFGLARRRRRR